MPEKTTMSGVLNIDKPAGITSHDVVAYVRKLLPGPLVGLPAEARRTKVGHTGTLDPFATGVLLVALGPATRLIQFSHAWDKEYEATFTLGAASDTDDATGRIIKNQPLSTKQPSKVEIQNVLQNFVGTIEQIPPAYSAVKIKGKKLYEYARMGLPAEALAKAGESVARAVTIHEIALRRYQYPEVELTIRCGTGTYIRSLARDLGEKLATGAYVSSLCRTRIGEFRRADSVPLAELSTGFQQHIHSPATLVSHLPHVTPTSHNIEQLRQGKGVPISLPLGKTPALAMYSETKTLVGVGAFDPATALLSPRINL